MVRKPLTPSYDGPYRVISKTSKTFKIQLGNRQSEVTIDRLKPAFLINNDVQSSPDHNVMASPNISQNPVSVSGTRTTRSGRTINRPLRYLIDT